MINNPERLITRFCPVCREAVLCFPEDTIETCEDHD